MLVDSHTHVIAADTKKYPLQLHVTDWVKAMPIPAETLIRQMDEAGVARSLVVQPQGAYGYDNSYAADAAAKYPDRLTGVCIVDVLQKDAPEQLSHWIEQRKMRGLRVFNGLKPNDTWLDDPVTFPTWERCRALRIPVNILTRYHHVPRIRRLLDRFTDIPIALDHMAFPTFQDGPPYASAHPLLDLARYPNVYLKLSAVNQYDMAKGKADQRDVLQRLVDRFSARRIIWGSNYPATYDRPYKDLVQMARDAVSFLPQDQQDLILGGNTARLYPA